MDPTMEHLQRLMVWAAASQVVLAVMLLGVTAVYTGAACKAAAAAREQASAVRNQTEVIEAQTQAAEIGTLLEAYRMALEPNKPDRSIFKDDRWNKPFLETLPAALRAMADRLSV